MSLTSSALKKRLDIFGSSSWWIPIPGSENWISGAFFGIFNGVVHQDAKHLIHSLGISL